MLELRKMNLLDIKEQWEYVTALPKDENGLSVISKDILKNEGTDIYKEAIQDNAVSHYFL